MNAVSMSLHHFLSNQHPKLPQLTVSLFVALSLNALCFLVVFDQIETQNAKRSTKEIRQFQNIQQCLVSTIINIGRSLADMVDTDPALKQF